MSTRNAETLNQAIYQFLKRNSLLSNDAPWEIKQSELGGFGIFSNRNIQPGELIFEDYPIIIGPRASIICPAVCVNCYKKENLRPCDNNCGLPVCSTNCQNSSSHQKECKVIRQWNKPESQNDGFSIKLLKSLTPIRSLLLSEEDKKVVRNLKAHRGDNHGHEIDVLKNELMLDIKEDEEYFMRFVCSVLDSNAFEVIIGTEEKQSTLRGLYPMSSLANHSCVPNTSHVFDDKQKMIVRAALFIPQNTEIFHSYTRLIWGTHSRHFHLLRTKHFLCKCPRCQDPTEFGTYMSAILCKKCRGKVVSLNPLKMKSKWQCEDCKEIVNANDVAMVTSLLGSTLKSFEGADWRIMLKFLDGKLPSLLPEFNEAAVELKYRLIWIFGHHSELTWTELTENLLLTKEKLCRDILYLLDSLGTGQCKMKGLVLYELYCSLNEITSRKKKIAGENEITEKYEDEMANIFSEASNILMYDVSAPNEIKQQWLVENNNVLK